ncbi:MAG: hypothetical protein IJI83_03165 [Oscillospiraceae bacterium]|nr:hypothetical protein [Oscillospiraceae bacterium]
MILLNTKYRCTEDFTKDDFNAFVFDWIVNTNDLRYRMDLTEITGENYLTYEYEGKKLSFVDYSDSGIMAAYHTGQDSEGIEWRLSIVFKSEEHEIYIQMSNSETTETGRFLRKFRKPDIIDELVDLKVIQKDGNITIDYVAHDIDSTNIADIESIIENRAGNLQPVIYVSGTRWGYYAINPDHLADRYAGMAHIFNERDDEVSYMLREKYGNRIPCDGAIAVYFPVRSLQPNFTPFGRYSEKETIKRISKALAFYYKSQNYGPMTTYDEISSIVISGRNRNLVSQNRQIIEESQKIADENKEIVETFDLDLKKTDEENGKLKQRVADLETENRILKERLNAMDKKPLLFYGKEEEAFPGEIRELLLAVLKETNLREGSRRADVINDVLENNPSDSSLEERQKQIRDILDEYRGLNKDQITRLERLGFRVTSEGKHHKLSYCNGRYNTVLAKTSSDFRAGKNVVATIIKEML